MIAIQAWVAARSLPAELCANKGSAIRARLSAMSSFFARPMTRRLMPNTRLEELSFPNDLDFSWGMISSGLTMGPAISWGKKET